MNGFSYRKIPEWQVCCIRIAFYLTMGFVFCLKTQCVTIPDPIKQEMEGSPMEVYAANRKMDTKDLLTATVSPNTWGFKVTVSFLSLGLYKESSGYGPEAQVTNGLRNGEVGSHIVADLVFLVFNRERSVFRQGDTTRPDREWNRGKSRWADDAPYHTPIHKITAIGIAAGAQYGFNFEINLGEGFDWLCGLVGLDPFQDDVYIPRDRNKIAPL